MSSIVGENMSLINSSVRLESNLKKQITASYESAIEDIGRDELDYVKKRLPRVLKTLKREQGSWLYRMAEVGEALVELCKTRTLSKCER